MKRIAIVLIAIATGIAILIVSISLVPNVTIDSFNHTGYNSPVGVAWNYGFTLNYTNRGLTDAQNVTLTFNTESPYQIERELSVFGSAPPHNYVETVLMGEPYSLGDIKAGETKEFVGEIWNTVADGAKIRGYAFSATLESNNVVLDRATIIIPGPTSPPP